jgi:hypothetical protein
MGRQLVLCALLCSGCFQDRLIPVKPSELPKLNDMDFAVMAATGPGGTAKGASSDVINVEGPDGRISAVTRPFSVELSTRADGTLRFDEPVRSTLEGDQMFVQGGNRAGRYPLLDISSASVVKREMNMPVFAGLLVAAIIVPVIVGVAVFGN